VSDLRDLLEHIIQCISAIADYTAALEHPLETPVIRDAVLRNLQIVAQSAMRLPHAIQARHPEINWSSLRAFRNVLVHDYMDLDLHEVELAMLNSLPLLERAIQNELSSLPSELIDT
jgi:uncharacterized protein with HEPN domain